MKVTKLENDCVLYACSMGKIFRVTHVCRSVAEANKVMEKDRDTTCIAEDNNGLVYLAETYGPVAPSAILEDYKRQKK